MDTQELLTDILGGRAATLAELRNLAMRLKQQKAFGEACKILALAREHSELSQQRQLRLFLTQQHALCTYKDPDLPAEIKFDRAAAILEEVEDLQTTKTQETLGLAGAIYKYKWEAHGQKQYLERSLAYYFRGYKEGAASDYGYTGINAAFVLDLLANLDVVEAQKAGTISEIANSRRQEATHIREDLVSTLPALLQQPNTGWLEKEWWFLVTIAEAYFGLGRYQEAGSWLKKAAALPGVPDWEKEATARQLASLARLQAGDSPTAATFEDSPAWKVLCDFLGDNAAGVRSAFIGKIGLALSGGGFRASLFHIGVLARLAEWDALRHVEVLSCVSGGSIIGAHYYLEVRKLLQTKRDDQITRDDYIALVEQVQTDFLAGVQRNIRMRVLAEFLTNLKMVFWPNRYSRTQRAGELYEEEIFSRVKDGKEKGPRWMDELLVKPLGESDDFTPTLHNWRRAAKVPILVLNTTTLNTGHNWQFTASWMGEPPVSIDAEIDGNFRLRRMYYREAPETHRKIRLGHAVAASACVPGIFEPLVLADLYPGRTVRLVDGGVHDNQGVASLLEQGCTVLLVSDASGQMAAENEPSGGILGVPLRSNGILQARVREAEYHELAARRRSSLLRGLMFVHLKKDLDVANINWVHCEEPQEAPPAKRLTDYGIRKDVQERLAAIRTDLDSFSDAEAYALMTSGYRMTEYEFPRSVEGFPEPSGARPQWRFLAVEEPMKREEGSENLMKLLDVASGQLFKVMKLFRPLQIGTGLLGVIAFISVLWVCWRWASFPVLTLGAIGSALIVAVAGLIVGKAVVRTVRFRETLVKIGMGIGMSLLGCIVARVYLHIFDRWYLRQGRIERVIRRRPLPPVPQPLDSAGAVPPLPQ